MAPPIRDARIESFMVTRTALSYLTIFYLSDAEVLVLFDSLHNPDHDLFVILNLRITLRVSTFLGTYVAISIYFYTILSLLFVIIAKYYCL